MKNIILTIAAVAALAFLSVSCKKDNAPAKPVVTSPKWATTTASTPCAETTCTWRQRL